MTLLAIIAFFLLLLNLVMSLIMAGEDGRIFFFIFIMATILPAIVMLPVLDEARADIQEETIEEECADVGGVYVHDFCIKGEIIDLEN